MSAAQKALNVMKYQLSGSLKKSGVNLWRFVFSGVERLTGNERVFFIELAMLNPWLSPSDVLLGFKPRVKFSAEDIQNVLAGTSSAQKIQSENLVVPSYVALRAGTLGQGAKQICRYIPVKDVAFSSRSFDVKAAGCRFDDSSLQGSLECSPSELNEHPEFLCNSGIISWNLRYEFALALQKGYKTKDLCWFIPGAKTIFSGNITLDGKEYDVIPKKSFGYIDRNWGKSYPEEWFHLSSPNISSVISGKSYQSSSFSLQGICEGRVSLSVNFEGKEYSFSADSGKRKFSSPFSCSQMPELEDGEKLHWSSSVSSRAFVVDVDVFCPARQLFVRSWEMPEGMRKTLKIFTGGTGSGEIRLYKRHGKNLELLEHCRIANVLCEFGQIEVPEN